MKKIGMKKRLKARKRRIQKIAGHIERVMRFARIRGRVTSADIQNLLRVGDATARRYLGRLKNEKKFAILK
jgi:Fic family protein